MSSALGLVRFTNTSNIYMGIYDGNSDIFYAKIFTPEECYNEKDDCYECFFFFFILYKNREAWVIKDSSNLSPIEIYSDYGGGFWWKGMADEESKLIDDHSCAPWDNDDIEIFHEVPDWVKKFEKVKFDC